MGGVNDAVDPVGEGGRTCLNDFRLNEAESGESRGGDVVGCLAFWREGFDGVEFVLLDQLKNGRFSVRDGGESGVEALAGRERVECALCGSPSAAKEGRGAGSSTSETDTPPMLGRGSLWPSLEKVDPDLFWRPNGSRSLLDDAIGMPAVGYTLLVGGRAASWGWR